MATQTRQPEQIGTTWYSTSDQIDVLHQNMPTKWCKTERPIILIFGICPTPLSVYFVSAPTCVTAGCHVRRNEDKLHRPHPYLNIQPLPCKQRRGHAYVDIICIIAAIIVNQHTVFHGIRRPPGAHLHLTFTGVPSHASPTAAMHAATSSGCSIIDAPKHPAPATRSLYPGKAVTQGSRGRMIPRTR